MLLSRRPAPSPSLSTLIAVAALSVGLAGCQSARARDAGLSAAPQSQPAAAILSPDSAAFIGLGERELAIALGQPKLVRKDAPAEIWQYRGFDCVVDFYLYDSDPADQDKRMEVAFVEARDGRAVTAPTERCVKSLLQSVSAAGTQGESF